MLPLTGPSANNDSMFAGLTPGHDGLNAPAAPRRSQAHGSYEPAAHSSTPKWSFDATDRSSFRSWDANPPATASTSAGAKSPFAFNAFDEQSWGTGHKGNNFDLFV